MTSVRAIFRKLSPLFAVFEVPCSRTRASACLAGVRSASALACNSAKAVPDAAVDTRFLLALSAWDISGSEYSYCCNCYLHGCACRSQTNMNDCDTDFPRQHRLVYPGESCSTADFTLVASRQPYEWRHSAFGESLNLIVPRCGSGPPATRVENG